MKKNDFLKEMRGLSIDEPKVRSTTTAEELMKLRFKKASNQLEAPHMIRILKSKIAQIAFVISEKYNSEKSTQKAA